MSARCFTNLSGHLSVPWSLALEARRDRSSLLLFHKIHSGAVSIEKAVARGTDPYP